ncbi:DUF1109 domain-containing protein [Phenylobacterium sp.]|uniref:DUF1109 domain-containing protein n=1 Tax=Phenylobacterium sp. TaxID=1871053 RepID=UPI0025F6ED57|nr:DUF1109 domain-containing protein [Phenylobacterium sp.]
METDKLIDRLAGDLRPASARQVPWRIAAVAALGGLVALALVVWWLGMRPDLMTAVHGKMFWMKAAYAAVLGLGGFLALERLARPGGVGRAGLWVAAAALLLLVGLGSLQLMAAPSEVRSALWMGQSWRRCPLYILALAAPILVATLLTVRGFAPTRLALAGGAAGLFAGGVAATAYGLHCPETALAFVATWYSLGVLLTAALGAALGPLVLRWR